MTLESEDSEKDESNPVPTYGTRSKRFLQSRRDDI